jgi:hypothetical protein
MSLRSCRVSFTDPQGIRHTVHVSAESLFEAAAMGLAALKKDVWVDPVGAAARLEVEVRESPVTYAVSVMQSERWLQGATSSPNERVRKDRLKGLLAR